MELRCRRSIIERSLFCVSTAVVLWTIVAAHAQSKVVTGSYEQPKVARASAILPKELRAGPNFRVDEKVFSDGYLYLFTVHSNYGDYRVRGVETLKTRVFELLVLNQLDEFTDTKVFVDAAKEAGIDILMAPVHGVKRVIKAVEDPEATWETVKGVPSGIGRLFGDVVDHVDRGITSVSNYISEDSKTKGKDSEDKGKKGPSAEEQALNKATEIGLKYVGFSQRESEWYSRYELDQFTTNKPLRDKIERIAAVQSAVKIGSKFVPGLGQLSMISTANKALSTAERLSLYKSPSDQREGNKARLSSMGVGEGVATRFLDNQYYSPSSQTRLVQALVRLATAKNRGAFVADAAAAQSQELGLVFVRAAECLAFRASNVTRFLDEGALPVAVVSDSRAVAPLALDHVIWTKQVATGAERLHRAVAKERLSGFEIRFSGTASERCSSELGKKGIVLKQKVDI
jgi:hypothetical protein